MSESSDNKNAFKHWFDREAVRALAAQVATVYPAFDGKRFERRAARGLDQLEMMARVRQLADALADALPPPPHSLAILRDSLPDVLPDAEAVTDGWLQWPVGQYIADYGTGHFDAAMEAMVELTMRFSSEFAVRPFVEHEPANTLARLLELTGHESQHVRRWCSEGVRPRLPWGRKLRALIDDPRPILPILEALRDDGAAYVQ